MNNKVPAAPDHPSNLPTQVDQAGLPAQQAPTQWPQLQPQPESGKATDWRRYLTAALRYKWLVVLTTVLGTAAGFVAMKLVKPVYRAQATVWIESAGQRGGVERGPVQQGQLLGGANWVSLLRTYVVLDTAVERLRLYVNPSEPADSVLFRDFRLGQRFAPGEYVLKVDESGSSVTLETVDGVVVEQAAPGDSMGGELGFVWAPTPTGLRRGMESGFIVETPRDVAVSLGERLISSNRGGGNFLSLQLEGTNPVQLAATVNGVSERFVEVAAELKREKLTELASILEEQLEETATNLREAEMELETFRVATISLPTEQTGPAVAGLETTRGEAFDQFVDTRVVADQIDQDLAEIRRVTALAPDSGLRVEALELVESVQRSSELTRALMDLNERRAELRSLRFRYTDEHPVVSRLAGEIEQLEMVVIPEMLGGLAAQLETRQGQLRGRIQAAERELRQIPPRMINQARLTRDVAVATDLYTMLQQRYEAARLAEASSIPDVRILDSAVVPERPLSNRGPIVLLMGIAGGLGLGLAGAILLDMIDRRVRYPDQVTSEMGLQILGVIPHMKASRNGTGAAETAPILEAVRGIRLSLAHACGTAGPVVVTVTSPGPGDGKSFVSSNLALSFADAGHRTLLIDGDARRGSLHRVLNVARKPGLTDYLAGNAGRAEMVQETAYSSLFFIGCGTRSADAPELLSSSGMSQLLTSLRASYSVIIVDSPPLGAGVDAFALGSLTNNMVLVLRLGQTDKELAEAKLDQLDRLPVRMLGAILNDVREGAAAKYYQYYSYYMPGYEAGEEEEVEAAALLEGEK